MGYNTALMICNDNLSEYQKSPQILTNAIFEKYYDGGRCGNITVLQSDHADATQLIAVGGNFATKVHTTYYVPSHHTVEGQVAILESWAKELGYKVVKK